MVELLGLALRLRVRPREEEGVYVGVVLVGRRGGRLWSVNISKCHGGVGHTGVASTFRFAIRSRTSRITEYF